jgi:hypothetical protein
MSKTPITSEVTTGLMFHVFKIAVGKSWTISKAAVISSQALITRSVYVAAHGYCSQGPQPSFPIIVFRGPEEPSGPGLYNVPGRKIQG